MIQKILMAGLMLVVAACASDGGQEEGADLAPRPDISGSDYVKVSRTPCFGACPVFDITLYGDGRLQFHGTRFTKVTGQSTRHTSGGRFLEALSALEMRGVRDLQSNYGRDACKTWATDHPSVTIEVRSKQLTKTINWYTGCRGLKDRAKLESLVGELEQILDVSAFVGTDEERAPARRK